MKEYSPSQCGRYSCRNFVGGVDTALLSHSHVVVSSTLDLRNFNIILAPSTKRKKISIGDWREQASFDFQIMNRSLPVRGLRLVVIG